MTRITNQDNVRSNIPGEPDQPPPLDPDDDRAGLESKDIAAEDVPLGRQDISAQDEQAMD